MLHMMDCDETLPVVGDALHTLLLRNVNYGCVVNDDSAV